MAEHPCRFGPFVLRLIDAEEVDVPVEVALHVRHPHPREAPQVALDPGAQVVDERHLLKVDRIPHIGLVRLRHGICLPYQPLVRLLLVVHDDAAFGEVASQGRLDPLRRGLAVAAHDRHRVLVHVDGDRDAELLLRETPLLRLAVAVGEVGVADIRLVDPHAVPQDDPVLVAVDGGEDAVPPLPSRLMGDAERLCYAVQGHVEAHEAYEGDPRRQLHARMLEDGAGKRRVAPFALRAGPSLDAGGGPAVFHGAGAAAVRAGRVRPELIGGLGQGGNA